MMTEELEAKKRVLMILESDYSPKGGGGAESQVRTLARYLTANGHQVTVVTPRFAWGPTRTAERIGDVAVARIAYPPMKAIGGLVLNLRFAAFLLGHGRRYDVWHVHIGHNLGAVASLLGALVDKPVLVKISGWWELEKGLLAPSVGPLARIARSFLHRADAVQAISTRVAAELERAGFDAARILVLPNAVDLTRFRTDRAPRHAGTPFTAVFVGRLVAEKGLDALFDAWAEAFAGRSDVRLELVGGGPLEADLRARAARLGIEEQVAFLGHKDDVDQILANADIGVLPSRIEGLSNALLEMMACGVPTIATRISGSEDFVVTGRNGWLCDVGDVPGLAAHLREASSMGAAQLGELGKNARADVEAKAAIGSVVERLLRAYRGRSS